MRFLFPLAFAANAFSMTALLVVFSLAGRAELAADAAIVQAASVMLFYAFSGNARSLVLNPDNPVAVRTLLLPRLVLLVPLSLTAYLLSTSLAGIEAWLAAMFVARRGAEWINELHLSERELRADRKFAIVFTAVQGCLFLLLLAAVTRGEAAVRWAAFVWSVAPALMSVPFAIRKVRQRECGQSWWPQLVPHMGSTVAISVSVYAFRTLILGMVDRSTAGDLFTAYAIGGTCSALFATALGPSLVYQRRHRNGGFVGLGLAAFVGGSMLAGLTVFLLAQAAGPDMLWLGKSVAFWKATGLSLIGGGIMLLAQALRLQLIQSSGDTLFGPDVLSNLAVIFAVPVGVLTLGAWTLEYAYMWNAAVVLAFYASVWQTNRWQAAWPKLGAMSQLGIGIIVCVPVFVTMSSGLFRDQAFVYDSHGQLALLPIPISVFACYAGILLLGNFERARESLTTSFLMFLLMALPSLAVTTGDAGAARDKLLLMCQCLLPIPALVLGQQFTSKGHPHHSLPQIALALLAVLVPLQLVATLSHGISPLAADCGPFSIYQHLQYVPTIIVGFFLIALFALFDRSRQRRLLRSLGPLMGVYVAASMSRLAIGLLAIGLFVFAVRFWSFPQWRRQVISLCLFVTVAASATTILLRNNMTWQSKFSSPVSVREIPADSGSLDGNGGDPHFSPAVLGTTSRWEYMRYYCDALVANPWYLLTGNPHPPERAKLPSAHNYYLDLTYNFGLGAIIPIISLLCFTCRQLYRHRTRVLASPDLLGLSLVVLFIAIADNAFKVTYRQPYPGIVSLFLWGVLLSRLNDRTVRDIAHPRLALCRQEADDSLHPGQPARRSSTFQGAWVNRPAA